MNTKSKVKRVPKRGHYDKETIHKILDRAFYCHIGFFHEGYPVVIPTAFGRHENDIYIHGSNASRMMKNISEGLDICVTVTTMTGLVLAKSAFHHSMNYESVVLFGRATLIERVEDKLTALKLFTDHVLPGRWEEARKPNAKELKGTMVLKLVIDEASAKIRTGGPVDDKEDEHLNIWTGVIPITNVYGSPEFLDKRLNSEIPDSVQAFLANHRE
jgi:nitroimidazol reductase NimA-like FMN-containing flavoprotein (pyridoxamine 5'-phosphate oxidase superfamily)